MNTEKGQRQVVRMFPDYADTVLWFGGPVAYSVSGLTQALVRGLRDWEQSYYDALTPELVWRSAGLARQFTVEGNRLAGRVADELGDGYEVKFRSYERGVPPRRFRGQGAALNSGAVAAFTELVSALSAEQERSARFAAARGGEASERFAFAPLSGAVFKPHQ